jgi:erythronate-4-phosphate dehydrogenase
VIQVLKFVVDRNIRAAEPTFGRHGALEVLDGRNIGPEHLRDADALIIRTATRVDDKLLTGSSIGFVGTTSIGIDHLDLPCLERRGITWANAPGCNADSAAQYTLAMIWLACERLGRRLEEQTVSVIGRGNVGSRVQRLLTALGVDTVANDPPLAEQGVGGLVSLHEALDRDIVCLHVPLTRGGPWPTFRFFGREQFGQMPKGALLVNTARGDVVNGEELKNALRAGRLKAALDVWPGEPFLDAGLLEACTVATPNVAGYSDDGKRNGTLMVYAAFCEWAGLAPVAAQADSSNPPELTITAGKNAVTAALEAACFVRRHDRELRRLSELTKEQQSAGFDGLRRNYPPRRDFQNWLVRADNGSQADFLEALGFHVAAGPGASPRE